MRDNEGSRLFRDPTQESYETCKTDCVAELRSCFVFQPAVDDRGRHDLDPATNQDGLPDGIIRVKSPDPGRALVSGRADDFFPFPPGSFDHLNAFKISPLWGVTNTAPYFHDNSAKTLEDVAEHYRQFFFVVTDPDGPGPLDPLIVLTDQDKQDIVAYMRLLK